MASCPRKVFGLNVLRQTVEIENADACNLCNECNKFAEDLDIENAVRIDEKHNKFIFTVEATGALAPEVIVVKALGVLKQKLWSLQSRIWIINKVQVKSL